ncbi:MAG TPA: DUF4142 domain-containing protein [Acidobacteriaceae bacterium]|nr:DUF4142 domain-containing protein [Acidobacteriaceae bacterium]
MQRILSVACCLALCSVSALAQKEAKTARGAMSDQQFVDLAAQTDMVEANLGQLAQTAAGSQAVKDYGQMLTTDHTSDFNKLDSVAQQAGLTRPNAIDSEHNKSMITPFQKLKGAAFDRKLIQAAVAGHIKAIAVYKKEAADAQSPAIKSYADGALPVLQKHLEQAQALEKSGGKEAK